MGLRGYSRWPSLYLLFIALLQQSLARSCDGDYSLLSSGHCVKHYSDAKLFAAAEQTCMNDGGHLVSIHNKQTNTAVHDFALQRGGGSFLLLGLQTFWSLQSWTDNSAYNYNNFAPGNPDSDLGVCAALQLNDGQWRSVQCNFDELPFICQQPPVVPAPTDMLFDVFFIIDVSESTQDFFYYEIEPWVTRLLSIYTLDQAHVRTGLIDMPGPDGRVFVTGFLSAYNSTASFQTDLDSLGHPLLEGGMYSPGSPARLSGALQRLQGYAIDTDNGYRPNIANHLAILVTGTSVFDNITAAVINANAVRDHFGIVTIGIGNEIDASTLQQISGGAACTYIAPDKDDLMVNGVQFVRNLILNAQMYGGKYC